MSNRNTICVTKNTVLYEDKTENGCVYIEVEDISECAFELWTNGENTSSRALVKINKKDFEKMIDAYKSRES
jgi:hypothetical protein